MGTPPDTARHGNTPVICLLARGDTVWHGTVFLERTLKHQVCVCWCTIAGVYANVFNPFFSHMCINDTHATFPIGTGSQTLRRFGVDWLGTFVTTLKTSLKTICIKRSIFMGTEFIDGFHAYNILQSTPNLICKTLETRV